jgi:hypothetical protein
MKWNPLGRYVRGTLNNLFLDGFRGRPSIHEHDVDDSRMDTRIPLLMVQSPRSHHHMVPNGAHSVREGKTTVPFVEFAT